MRRPIITSLREVDPEEILYSVGGRSNCAGMPAGNKPIRLESRPVSYERYLESFRRVRGHLYDGDTYLANLTFRTPVDMDAGLRELFLRSSATFRLFLRGGFTVFSPERFVRIADGCISSYPMKGTADASLPGARESLLKNEKELAEHLTIVDLLRNDLSIVAKKVRVTRFRYLEKILTCRGALFQTSSEIRGELSAGYHAHIGDIIAALLPAGSVTGAPKKKTVEIISAVEDYSRGFYTGVFGVFDGSALDSGVMIRFIEQEGDEYFYKSGGGITVYSDPLDEYREMISKIYVPFA